jgi:hypothetical protein
MMKQPVWLWIPKLGEQVLIDQDHPLAATAIGLPLQPDQSEEVGGDECLEVVQDTAGNADGWRA